MGNRRIVKYISDISDKEKKILNNVISMYSFKVYDIKRCRSAYKLQTSEGNICLKKMKHGEKRILYGSILTTHLKEKGFTNTAIYLKTKNNMTYIKSNKLLFYATTWIEGNECKVDSIGEVLSCVELLAKFHLCARGIENKSFKIKNNLKDREILFSNYMNDFIKYKKVINNMRVKNEFDKLYIENIEYYNNRAFQAISIINRTNYHKLLEEANKNKTICHNSFYYQNIMKEDNKYYIIDLDTIVLDVQVVDLAKFIRRLMYKKEFGWDFRYAEKIIEKYSSIKKISTNELYLILSYIMFPHKFWKIGKKRYKKRKNYSEGKFNHKIKRILRYKKMEEDFINKFTYYIEDKIKGRG